MLKEVFGFLQNCYRARLYRGYTVNAPWTFSMVWKACKAFVEETTALKINISTKAGDANMWNHIDKSQIEKRYGGEAEDLTEFWPPQRSGPKYFVEADNAGDILITKEEYKKRKGAGELDAYRTKDFQ
jgi:hypothetical protein